MHKASYRRLRYHLWMIRKQQKGNSMRGFFTLLKECKEKRKMILSLAFADFRKRFVGSYFGAVWMLIQPLVTIAIYAFIFGPYGFKSSPPVPNVSYTTWLIPGMVPWFFFSEVMNMNTGILQEYQYLVKKVVFPIELLPIIKLISCSLVHLFFLLVMFLFALFSREPIFITWPQVLFYSFATAFYALSLSFFTSAVSVFFKDMQQIVGIVLQFGIWMTPIMYDESLFTGKAPFVKWILKLNPMYYIVAGYRDSMLTGHWFFERPGLSLYFWGVTAVLFLFSLRFFRSLRPHFSDVL